MTQACTECRTAAPGESRLKGAALFVGAIVFCPCHLPLTGAVLAGGLAAMGAWAWLANAALLYVLFGVTYLFVILFGARYLLRHRDAERAREALHAQHAAPPSSSTASA